MLVGFYFTSLLHSQSIPQV